MIWCAVLLLAVVQGDSPSPKEVGAWQPERLSDLGWMLELPAPGEQMVEIGWLEGQADRSQVLAGPLLLTALEANPPLGTLLFHAADADADAPPLLSWDLAAIAAGTDGASIFDSALVERAGSLFYSVVPMPFPAGVRVTHRLADGETAALTLRFRSFGADSTIALPTDAALDKAWGRGLELAAEKLAVGRPPIASRGGFKAGAAARIGKLVEAAPDQGEFQWIFRGHGVLRWWELRFLGDAQPAEIDALLRSLTVRVEVGTTKKMETGTVLFEVPLGDFLGSALDPDQASGAWCDRLADGSALRFRLPIAYRDGMKLMIRSNLRQAARFRLDCGVDPIEDAEQVPPLTLRASWGRRTDSGQLPALHIAGPVHVAGYSYSAVSGGIYGLEWSGESAYRRQVQRPIQNRFLGAPVLDGPMDFGRSVLTRQWAWDAPTSSNSMYFETGIRPSSGLVEQSLLVWWYGRPDAEARWATADGWSGVEEEQQRGPVAVPPPPFSFLEGALEGEQLTVQSQTTGSNEQVRFGADWSGLRYLHWQGEAGAQCNLRFPVTVPAEYRVLVGLAEGEEYGRVQFLIDGRVAGDPIDCTAEGSAQPAQEIEITRLRLLPRADHILSLRTVDGRAVGLDTLRLQRVDRATEESDTSR